MLIWLISTYILQSPQYWDNLVEYRKYLLEAFAMLEEIDKRRKGESQPVEGILLVRERIKD